MSTHILSACWALKGMTPAQKLVLISLADQANDDGVCWPGMSRLVQRTCLSERAVRNAIRDLESSGVLSTTGRSGTSNVYKIDASKYDEAMITPAPYAAPAPDAAPAGNAGTPAPDAAHPGTRCRPPRHVVPPNHKEPTKNHKEPSVVATAAANERLFKQQDQTPRTYRMTTDWQPPETFKASFVRAGVDASLLTEAVLEKFRNHYAEGQECTTGQWVNKLIDWLNREKVSQQERPHPSQNQETKPKGDGSLWYCSQPLPKAPPRVEMTDEEIAALIAYGRQQMESAR